LFNGRHGRMPQGFVEVCVDIMPQAEAGKRPLDYLLKPPVRVPWELRVILYRTRGVTPKKIYHGEDECCCCDVCLPPNQSDVKLVCGLSGSKEEPSGTDVHLRCIDGEALFNWRTIHALDLPAPDPLCTLKLQIWNINWKPDDCIAEAAIPLWGFFEAARRRYIADKKEEKKTDRRVTFGITKQWVSLRHPVNSDKGDVEVEVELLPKEVAVTPDYRAGAGEHSWGTVYNSDRYPLQRPIRPPSSFPWYRLDLQLMWRVSYCCKKFKWCAIITLIIIVILAILLAVLRKQLGI